MQNNSVTWKRQGSGDKEIKRAQGLFNEIQTVLINFVCLYFNKLDSNIEINTLKNQSQNVFEIMFIDDTMDEQGNPIENFTVEERLIILTKLNPILIKNTNITKNKKYWDFIATGLCDLDPQNRNKAVGILQYNIH